MLKEGLNDDERDDERVLWRRRDAGLEKMKAFMEKCDKAQFTDDDIKMMQQFCGQTGKPDAEKMKQLMEKCGCRPS
jgi:hypothetical protein